MDPKERLQRIRLAIWIWRVQRERIKYIARQNEHHQKRSFQEEFVVFLKKNKVAYDERYIWN